MPDQSLTEILLEETRWSLKTYFSPFKKHPIASFSAIAILAGGLAAYECGMNKKEIKKENAKDPIELKIDFNSDYKNQFPDLSTLPK